MPRGDERAGEYPPGVDPQSAGPVVPERQLYEQLARLRHEQTTLREITATGLVDAKRSARLRQIDVESAALWSGIRSARAAGRAAYRARVAPPPLDPFRRFVRRRPRE